MLPVVRSAPAALRSCRSHPWCADPAGPPVRLCSKVHRLLHRGAAEEAAAADVHPVQQHGRLQRAGGRGTAAEEGGCDRRAAVVQQVDRGSAPCPGAVVPSCRGHRPQLQPPQAAAGWDPSGPRPPARPPAPPPPPNPPHRTPPSPCAGAAGRRTARCPPRWCEPYSTARRLRNGWRVRQTSPCRPPCRPRAARPSPGDLWAAICPRSLAATALGTERRAGLYVVVNRGPAHSCWRPV